MDAMAVAPGGAAGRRSPATLEPKWLAHVCVYACVRVCVCMCVYVCMYVRTSVCLSVHLSVYLSVCLSVRVSVCPCVFGSPRHPHFCM